MKYEILESNKHYHIYNCGNNRENIFIEEANYFYFLKLMAKYVNPIADVISYCLLKNHFHLLVQIKNIENEKLISQSFSNFFNAYAKAINKKYNRTGSLFKDRFSRKSINNHDYLKRLVLYIHLNPIHHGFVDNIEYWKHSSYYSIISEKETLLCKEYVIELFEDVDNFKHVHE
jgi:REP element-mobilizing transposase RayT